MIYLRLGHPEQALQYFQRALDVNPNLIQVRAAVEELKRLLLQRSRESIWPSQPVQAPGRSGGPLKRTEWKGTDGATRMTKYRGVDPQTVTDLFVYLASDASRGVTGRALDVERWRSQVKREREQPNQGVPSALRAPRTGRSGGCRTVRQERRVAQSHRGCRRGGLDQALCEVA